jgi:branched-chain amino acid transport system ATP-binding protein
VTALLTINEIDVYYGDLKALKNIRFQVNKGELVALVGSNGAGKTTLMNTIMGLIKPRKGTIEFNGENIDSLPPDQIVKKYISLVPESKMIFPQMSIYENLLMGAYPSRCRKNLKQNLDGVYDMFPRLHERRSQLAGTMSGGEIQMLIIGRALMSEPQLLLVDELSIGLSPKLTHECFRILERLHKERDITILLAEQNIYEALDIADRGIVLENGEVVMTGGSEELLSNEHIKEAYLGI